MLRTARAAGFVIPKVRKHTLRTGAARVEEAFCVARAASMQACLQALANALNVRLLEASGPEPLLSFLCKGNDVESVTPEDRWFTIDGGWPAAIASQGPTHCAPRQLTPTRHEAPQLYPTEKESLGEVRVEVLEARGLIAADTFSQVTGRAVIPLVIPSVHSEHGPVGHSRSDPT